MNKKILFTGGHLSPLLSVYEEVKNKADVVVIGRKYSFEADKAESLEYEIFSSFHTPFYDIHAPRFQRRYTKHTIPSFFKSPKAILLAYTVLKKEKPDVIMSFGGYVSLPVAIAAYIKKIPIVIHEQTQEAGVTNKIISKFASKICISFPSSKKYFPKNKTVLTGNPVRPEIFDIKKSFEFSDKKPLLYITGGSTGAHPINQIILEMLPALLQQFNVLHQTGDAKEFEDFKKLSEVRSLLPEKEKKSYIIKKFILPDEIGWVYHNADVVLSRAGVNTVAELLALSKKALLIPLPHGQKNEQLKNAKYFEEKGLGFYISQDEATPSRVFEYLEKALSLKVEKVKTEKNNSAKMISEILLSIHA